jgi:hypothetical protein
VRKFFLRFSAATIGLFFVLAPGAAAQDPARTEELNRLRTLIDAGAAPRTALDKALAEQADRDDETVLQRTLYGSVRVEDLNEQQTAGMVDAARRRADRIQKKVDQMRPLVQDGVFARNQLTPFEEELAERLRTLQLAQGRARVFGELLEMARAEAAQAANPAAEDTHPVMVRFDGSGIFNELQFRRVQMAFEKQFEKPLPVSAYGETVLHKSLGFDHRGRVDLALAPDQPEGLWLRQYLEKEQIPFFMFRAAVAGSATGPHFHLGPPSLRVKIAD